MGQMVSTQAAKWAILPRRVKLLQGTATLQTTWLGGTVPTARANLLPRVTSSTDSSAGANLPSSVAGLGIMFALLDGHTVSLQPRSRGIKAVAPVDTLLAD